MIIQLDCYNIQLQKSKIHRQMNKIFTSQNHSKSFNISLEMKAATRKKSLNTQKRQQTQNSLKRPKTIKKYADLEHTSFHASQKYFTTKKRRLSLTKTLKMNSSVHIQNHMAQEKFAKIQKLFKLHKYNQAILLIEQLLHQVEYGKMHKDLYYMLAFSQNSVNKKQQALVSLNIILKNYPQFEDGLLFKGKIYRGLKKYSQAISNFKIAKQLNPKNYHIYIELGKCYKCINNYSQADRVWKQGRKVTQQDIILSCYIIENLIQMNKLEDSKRQLSQLNRKLPKTNSDCLYLSGMYAKQCKKINQACIFFERSITQNNSERSVVRSMNELLKLKIDQRDYYSAHHTINRVENLNIKSQKLQSFKGFLDGVMLIMKKKFMIGINILNKCFNKQFIDPYLLPLFYKFLGYAYFRQGLHNQAIAAYIKLSSKQLDIVSKYNLLLVEGIVAVDKDNKYKLGIKKFQQAKKYFPKKVQPYIYIGMTIIKQAYHEKKKQQQKIIAVLKALDEINIGSQINPHNSTLLYHRTIINFTLQNWEQAVLDINHCIEKAEENLPKYFYIRGLAFACVKDLSKAINQYSICISLDANHKLSYLQRAKCNFLMGDAENGFKDLKIYMQMNPDDFTIHKWIGDLLYEGKSYTDALRAYNEVNDNKLSNLYCMKAKCYFRTGALQDVVNCLKVIEKSQQREKDKSVAVDFTSIKLLQALLKGQSNTIIGNLVKALNRFLEQQKIGFLFQLIDCMNLLGVATFYLGKYQQAYESFLLVLQLFQSLSEQSSLDLKSQCSQQQVNLQIDKLFYHLFLCQVLKGQWVKATNILKDKEILQSCQKFQFGKQFRKILELIEIDRDNILILEPNDSQSIFRKFKKIQVRIYNLKIKTRLFYGLFHDESSELYSQQVTKDLIYDLKPSYIDNMPQGPWIKRNQFGVVFTEELIESENSTLFDSSIQNSFRQSQQASKNPISKRQQLLNFMKLDKKVQDKLNNLMKKK